MLAAAPSFARLAPAERRRLAHDHVPWITRVAQAIGGRGYRDLVGPGWVGLFAALDRFDPAGGVALEVFAYRDVRREMVRALRRDVVAVGTRAARPLARQAAAWLDDVVAAVHDRDEADVLHFAIAWHLTARQVAVVRLRFGLDGGATLTRAAVGRRLGVSRWAVGRIEAAALARLRRALGKGVAVG